MVFTTSDHINFTYSPILTLTHTRPFPSILNYCLQTVNCIPFYCLSVHLVSAYHAQRSAFGLCFTIKNIGTMYTYLQMLSVCDYITFSRLLKTYIISCLRASEWLSSDVV